MQYLKMIFKYLHFIISGAIAMLIIMFFNESITLPNIVTSTGQSVPHLVIIFKPFDYYMLFNLLIILPLVRATFKKLYQERRSYLYTYKDRAMSYHHQDVQNSRKGYKWIPDGITTNPYEYNFVATQSYDDITNDLIRLFFHSLINILVLIFAPIFILIYLIKLILHHKK